MLNKKENLSFEQKLKKANELLEKLSSTDVTLEESVRLYEDGLKLIKEAQKQIEEAKLKVEQMSR